MLSEEEEEEEDEGDIKLLKQKVINKPGHLARKHKKHLEDWVSETC